MLSLLITVVVVLLIVGVALWLLDFINMDGTIKRLIHGLVILVAVLWILFALLAAFGHPVHLATP